jgi:6-methylsalicylic acid synthase
VVFISKNDYLLECYKEALKDPIGSSRYYSAQEFAVNSKSLTDGKDTIITYIPERVESLSDVSKASEAFCEQLLELVKNVASCVPPPKVFVITERVSKGETPTALAQAPLLGLARIIASEQPDLWGGLIDIEDSTFPFQAIKYAQGADVIKVSDTVARTARLRSIPREKLLPQDRQTRLFPRPEGTYLISGGLGALGMEVANYLIEKGARRLVLLSRRALPPRHEWATTTGTLADTVSKIKQLELFGATIHVASLDLGAPGSDQALQNALTQLSLPPILGVVHAAGVLEDQLILETTTASFNRVLAPKIAGALTLHRLFPVTTLDFFVLFSSCGQLFGFPGQASYASGNAFLDTLATYRASQGDNAVAFQWTSWRGMGMAASTEFINAELESKGITDVTREEAFRAWDHLSKYDMDHGVVLRSMAFDEGEPLPVPILNDIAVRRPATVTMGSNGSAPATAAGGNVPTSGPELKAYLLDKVSECVVKTLQLASVDDVDPKVALSELGMDSVMTVGLRRQLQQTLKVKVPPTLIWSHPTVSHLVNWFAEKMTN